MLKLKVLLLVGVVGLLASLTQVTQAHVSPPHAFAGAATVDSLPAPSGTLVSAWSGGMQLGRAIISESGQYALGVNQPPTNEPLTFKIDGQLASESAIWIRDGATILDLNTISYLNLDLPPHIFVGTAKIAGTPAKRDTIVTAWVGSLPVSSGLVRDGRYVIKAPQPLSGEALTFTVGDFYTPDQMAWKLGGSSVLNLDAGLSSSSLRIALEPVESNLERVFQEISPGDWTFFDPRRAFASINTLSILTPGETYWIKVTLEQNVIVGNKLRNLQPGLNKIIW